MTKHRDFDAVAATWDEEPRRVTLAGEIAEAIRASVPLTGEWDAMDFGCGTGLVTLQLAPHLRSIVGADSSRGMLDRLEAKLPALGLHNVRTTTAELFFKEASADRFHLITSAMTLHHVADNVALLSSLRTRLHPGGYVALADLATEDGSFHEDPTGIFHHGFSPEQLTEMLTASGFSSVSVRRITQVVKGERHFPVLLATAVA